MAKRYADLTGLVDGVTATFTLPLNPGENVVHGSMRLWVAGLSQRPNIAGGGYFDEQPPNQFITETPPDEGDHLEVEWENTDGVVTVLASGTNPFL